MFKARLLMSAAAFGAFALAAIGAHAQSAPAEAASQVQAVVVTAERRSTNIQKTPVAITAVAAAALDKSFITDIVGLNGIVPSLETTRTSGFESIVTNLARRRRCRFCSERLPGRSNRQDRGARALHRRPGEPACPGV